MIAIAVALLTLTSAPPAPPISRGELCVSTGEIDATKDGLRITGPEVRAFVRWKGPSRAELRFRYDGPTQEVKRLASGELRRQFGIKLRAKDTCNLVYAMWHFEPTPGLGVSVKSNPGKSTHAQCGANGYETLRPAWTRAVPAPLPGTTHTFAAELEGTELRLFADGQLVWRGTVPPLGFAFDGPAGLRSDNAGLTFQLRTESRGSAPLLACPAERGSWD
jgi:hypothetical protein